MATAVKRKLSGSTDGKAIKIAATSSSGDTIHTSVAGTTAGTFDEIWLYAYNGDTTARELTIQFGGTSTPDNDIKFTVPSKSGAVLLIPGWILQNGAVVRAYAAVTNVITITGFVNSITD